MARWYEAGGAAAISVLTEENFFDGCLEDLRAVKQTVSLPVLRKDFIIDEYQVFESLVAGADAILLIAAALDNQGLEHLRQLAEDELGMDALVEVHTEGELRRAESCGARLIGVNNRDLKTFEVSLETSIALAARAPSDTVLVSESGLRSHDDLLRLRGVGFSGFLVGETLMRAASPVNALRELIGDAQVL
jgi:indole-3-glycerol phosphate synthase